MAISFEESLRRAREAAKKTSQALTNTEEAVEEAAVETAPTMFAMRRAATADEGDAPVWILDDSKYRYYPEYTDENISEIDSEKNVVLNEAQINLTQEKNSQFIPFRMPRYYDGFDLTTAVLNIRFVNAEGSADFDQPINVYYSDNKIKFGWLVDGRATAIAGKLDFEIQAVGKNSGGDDYVWKTKPCESMNVLQSLEGNGVIEPDHSWVAGFLTEVTEKVAEAQIFAADAWSAAEAAENLKAEAVESAELAKASADTAQEIIDTAKVQLELSVNDAVDAAVEGAFADYYNRSEVDELLSNIDVTEELNALKAELTEQIESIDGLAAFNVEYDGTNLAFYNGDDEIKNIEIHSEPSAEWTTAFRETLDADIAESKVTYDIELIPPEDSTGKNKLTLQEIYKEGQLDEIRIPKTTVYFAAGGTGGGTSDYGLKINLITAQAFSITMEGDAKIVYRFSGTDSTGDPVPLGYYSWIVGSTTLATGTVYAGVNTTFDATPHLKVGTNTLRLLINDDNGQSVTKTYTIQKIDLRMESTFKDNVTQPMGDVVFSYTPYGATEKDIHILLDGEEIDKITMGKTSGTQMTYSIPAQEHGAHLLDIYSTALVGATIVESNHIVRDILWYDESTGIPVIGCTQQNFEMRQYDTVNLNYVVYDPSTETPTVTLAVDGRTVSTLTLEKSENIWQFKSTEIGKHTLTITCGDTVKTLYATVVELDIDVEPVVAGLAFDFDPSGRSNADANRLWTDGDVAMTVSDNFDWVNGGYQIDDAGDQYFCIKAGTSAEINYKLFADDAKRNGKEFKLIFKTTNVAKPDATFLSCVDDTTGADHIGIRMDVHEASVYGQSDSLNLFYSEEDIIEFEFNITKDTEAIPMVMGYEDGVSTRPMIYNIAHNFTQNTPKFITLGSPDCDLHIYRFKVYNTSLTDRGILSNFIADARNAEEMIARYERNQIYDENQMLDPDVLAEKCPWLRVYKLSAPYFTNNKSDKVPGTTIQQIYMNGDRILDNWICYNCMHSGQGTSSNNYGAAGRNLDFIMNKSGVDGVKPYFILGDGSRASKITMTRTSVPTAYLNAKVNIASSNNLTNAMLANRYNEFEPYKRPFIRTANLSDAYSEEEISAMSEDERSDALEKLQSKADAETVYIKDTMEFHNCVIFIQETDPDVSTHREFADNDWHFYAIGNIGDSKKSDNSRLTDPDDKYECCVEIMDVELPLSDFPADTMMNAMGWTEDETTKEKIYTWAKDENLGILYEKIDGEYVLTEDTEVDLNKTYYVDILEHDDFSEDFTYGWRYIYEDGTDEENAEVFDYCKRKWIELYRFITTSTDEEFKANLENYFVKDSALYNYLFTTRYCMVDNRAKNTFWHYGKTGEMDSEGNPIRKWDLTWGYDNDTSLGLNNYGKQVYRYGLEDTDVDEKGEEVFRESDSTFFCRIRDLFSAELKAMYNTLESKNAWHAESFLNRCDEWQNEFPEELWRIDIERKYLRTYNGSFINGKGDAQFLENMANGKMKYHRRQWERSQEKYMASKYQSSVASSDNSVFRCSVPSGDLVVAPNYRLKLTPYAYMYLNVKYGTQSPIQLRAEPNVVYEIPFDGEKADIVDVYSSSLIQDFGDLSTCYVATADTSKAEKVKRLIFGNDTPGYDNPNFTSLTTGANHLLEELNIENVSGLTQALDLSALANLKELYAHGSGIGGAAFADGGRIEIAELPAISSLTMKNLVYLTNLDITDLSKLTSLTVEGCDSVDLLELLDAAPNLNRVRLTGIDWSFDDTSLLERLYGMSGYDKNGYNTDRSVLAGQVYVRTIFSVDRDNFKEAWPDLTITYPSEGLIEQHVATFYNEDRTEVLDVQYIVDGEWPVDPTTREENPITPTIPMTQSHYFTFAGWDKSLNDRMFDNKDFYATYDSHLRQYTITYKNELSGEIEQQNTVEYGAYVEYDFETNGVPVYTALEDKMIFYLFREWDKSGYVTGDKVVTAQFDVYKYDGGLLNTDFENMTPVQIYALTKLAERGEIALPVEGYIEEGSSMSFVLGNDIDYNDIKSEVLIDKETVFDGTNHLDTGISLFEEDQDFMLAIDYKFASGCPNGGILMSCIHPLLNEGFELWFNSYPQFTWNGEQISGTNASVTSLLPQTGQREVVVLRHQKGSGDIMVYRTNITNNEVTSVTVSSAPFSASITQTLVFGCGKNNSGNYVNYANGTIYWAKLWRMDLGDAACRSITTWFHEPLTMEIASFNTYELSKEHGKMCSFSMIAKNLIGRSVMWNDVSPTSNVGGWAECSLREYMNNRVYKALPQQIRALLKQVRVASSVGNSLSVISYSDCYITAPAYVEISDASATLNLPYRNEGTTISYMAEYEADARKKTDYTGTPQYYWTRSPRLNSSSNTNYDSYYVWGVNSNGAIYNGLGANGTAFMLIIFAL